MGDAADTLGERLKALREAANQTQEQVARAIEVNSGTYSRWERGTSKPHADEIVALSKHFGCGTDYILIGGVLTDHEMPRELHRFLATKWGRYAHKRGWVKHLRGMRTMPDGNPPSVKSYTRMTKAFMLSEDEGDDSFDDDEPPKSAH